MQQPTNHGICRWSKVEKHPVHLGGGVWGLQCMGDNVIKCILPGTASLHQLRWWASLHLTCVYCQQCEHLHTCAVQSPPVQKSKNLKLQSCIKHNMVCIKIQPLHPTHSVSYNLELPANDHARVIRALTFQEGQSALHVSRLTFPVYQGDSSCHDKSAHLMLAVEFRSSAVVNWQKLLILLKREMDVSKVKGQ